MQDSKFEIIETQEWTVELSDFPFLYSNDFEFRVLHFCILFGSGSFFLFLFLFFVPVNIRRKRLPLIRKRLRPGHNPCNIGILTLAASSCVRTALTVFKPALLLLFLTFHSSFFPSAFLSGRP